MFCCTVLGAAAQVCFKFGAKALGPLTFVQIMANPLRLVNPALLAAYCLYGANTIMLTLALRKGQLSILYPIISLTYVWVAILSVLIFDEKITRLEGLGLATVVAGVAVLGLDSRR